MPYSVGFGQLPLVANGNISPRRFIVPVASAGNALKAVQASGSTLPYYGISSDFTRYTPGSPADDGYCAIAGEPLGYAGPGMVTKLDLGATCANATVPVVSDASGKGTPLVTTAGSTTAVWIGAMLLQTGVNGEAVDVYVLMPSRHIPSLT